jgi:hypothetical protein
MEYLMRESSSYLVGEILAYLGFTSDQELDRAYNLLWLLLKYPNSTQTKLTPQQVGYLGTLSADQLLILLPESYHFAGHDTGQTSLLFAMMSGQSLPKRLFDLERYEEIRLYSPEVIWRMATIRWNLTRLNRGSPYVTYAPYELVAAHLFDDIEAIFEQVILENLDDLIESYQVVLPEGKITTKMRDFLEQIAAYGPVFNRPEDFPEPPLIEGIGVTTDLITAQEVEKQLEIYTTRELLEVYEPVGKWRTRKELITLIIQEGRGQKYSWSWRDKYCQEKKISNNPVLSYGPPRSYQCYDLSTLIQEFTLYPLEFRVPSCEGTRKLGPIEEGPKFRVPGDNGGVFTLESLLKLQELLSIKTPYLQATQEIQTLNNLVTQGLEIIQGKIQKLKLEYNKLNFGQQTAVKSILFGLFFQSMYSRGWKGPGAPWPYEVEPLILRDEKIRVIQITLHHQLVEDLREKIKYDYPTTSFLSSLPGMFYNFILNQIALRNWKLMEHLDEGDDLLQTTYAIITRIFEIKDEDLDSHLQLMTLILDDRERYFLDHNREKLYQIIKDQPAILIIKEEVDNFIDQERTRLSQASPSMMALNPSRIK